MTARTLSGKDLAARIRADVTERAEHLRSGGITPALAVVLATDDPSTASYVRSIVRASEKVGIAAEVVTCEPGQDVAERVRLLASDPGTHGIIVQTPLPEGVDFEDVAAQIPPAKDVDGANPASLGRLAAGQRAFAPATAAAVLEIAKYHQVPLNGSRAVVVGRSTVVGKPAALLLLAEHATVTVCHSRTKDLAEVTRTGDVLVAAVGRSRLITSDYVRPGATVIDVGTNYSEDGTLTGDVDAESVAEVAGGLTPVPGGVGPVTTALLLRHTLDACRALTLTPTPPDV